MISKLIENYEEIKKYIFVLNIGDKGTIAIKFDNKHFYHLYGLHKTNIDTFFPTYLKSTDSKYKYIKKNSKQFDKILENQIKEKHSLELRISTFSNIIDLLKGVNVKLYNLKEKVPNSLYNGDYGISKIYNNQIHCLLGLKSINKMHEIIKCAPQSWMASLKINRLVENKKPMYLNGITKLPISCFDENENIFIA